MFIPRREFVASLLAGLATTRLGRAGEPVVEQAEAAGDAVDWMRELGRHRIRTVEPGRVRMRWPRQVGKNARLDVHGFGPNVTICKITTDRGPSGWGAVRGSSQDVERLRDKVKDRPITEFFDTSVGITRDECAPLDFALHDLAGKILKIPVHEMIGDHGAKSNPCYSGMIYFDDLEPPDDPAGIETVLENCRFDRERGYRQLKVKIGRGNKWMPREAGLARDVEVTRAIARNFDDVTILVDGNNGFTADGIIRYLDGIGDVPLLWIEEPFHETVEDYTQLRDWLVANEWRTLLADGEAGPDWKVLDALVERHLLDVQLVDVVGYGFTAWRKLMPSLVANKVQASPHAWGDALKTNYTAHLAAGLGNVVTIEGVTCASEDVDFGDYVLAKGKLTVSDEPGFGMTLIG